MSLMENQATQVSATFLSFNYLYMLNVIFMSECFLKLNIKPTPSVDARVSMKTEMQIPVSVVPQVRMRMQVQFILRLHCKGTLPVV